MVIADLEIHSRYARACSKSLSPVELDAWARRKGVEILSSGDITHPLWRREFRRITEECESGFYCVKSEYLAELSPRLRGRTTPRFVLGGEVALMFRSGDTKGRRIHVLFLAPSFDAVEKLVALINDKGKLASDGRPILSMSGRDFVVACHAADERIVVIPAHIWTPWFGTLGSKSGFDSFEEAFGDQAEYVKTFETGLSADPAMCWGVGSLGGRVLISSSDAHSAPNIMREATLLHGEVGGYNYDRLRQAIIELGNPDYDGTIEFYPEEGKYHLDGHAGCKVVLEPEETDKLSGVCPACGKPLTVGVKYRTHELATEPSGVQPSHAGRAVFVVPLQEIIAEALGRGKSTKGVRALYFRMTDELGTEYQVLRERSDWPAWVPPRVAEGICKVRQGEVIIKPGYDGLYGVVRLFDDNMNRQPSLWEG